jgi:hypothetical protein
MDFFTLPRDIQQCAVEYVPDTTLYVKLRLAMDFILTDNDAVEIDLFLTLYRRWSVTMRVDTPMIINALSILSSRSHLNANVLIIDQLQQPYTWIANLDGTRLTLIMTNLTLELNQGMFHGMRNIESLTFRNCCLSGITARSFDGLSNIKYIQFEEVNMNDCYPAIFQLLTKLTLLSMRNVIVNGQDYRPSISDGWEGVVHTRNGHIYLLTN